jgi:integrase
LDAGDVKLRKPAVGHVAMIAAQSRTGYAGASNRFSSRAYRGTRNLRAVQMLLGHESIATTEGYVAVDNSEIRATMMAAAFQEPVP